MGAFWASQKRGAFALTPWWPTLSGLDERRYGEIVWSVPGDDGRDHGGRGEGKRRQEANVSFHLSLALSNFAE
jgi:hypothetical protein